MTSEHLPAREQLAVYRTSLERHYRAEVLAAFRAGAQLIAGAARIGIISHYNPDADAYGSSIGLAECLAGAGKTVSVVNESGILDRFRFLPRVAEVLTALPEQIDLVVACDCGDIQRVGDTLKESVLRAPKLINLDHHASNALFGAVNIVDDRASSASEIVFDWVMTQGWPIPERAAAALFAGIMADTGSFRYLSTSSHTFQAAALLVDYGAKPAAIAEQLFSGQSVQSVRLNAAVLSSAEFMAGGQVCVLTAGAETFAQSGAEYEDAEGLVEKGRDIQGVKISVFLRWDGSLWRVSMRSADPRFDVAAVARHFGGGGHKVAAAFRWRRELAELRGALLPLLEKIACGTQAEFSS